MLGRRFRTACNGSFRVSGTCLHREVVNVVVDISDELRATKGSQAQAHEVLQQVQLGTSSGTRR